MRVLNIVFLYDLDDKYNYSILINRLENLRNYLYIPRIDGNDRGIPRSFHILTVTYIHDTKHWTQLTRGLCME